MCDTKFLDAPAVIFDNGSGSCKAGFSGEGLPRVVMKSIVGRPKAIPTMVGAGQKDFYIGEEAQSLRGVLSLKYPVRRGVITNWDDMEKIWKHVYSCELHVKSCERPVLLTEVPLNPLKNREKMAEVMFEVFGVPAMYVALQATLALYTSGRTTGIVVDSGDGVTHTVPLYEGYCVQDAISRLNVAGRDITKYLMRLLLESGYSFLSTAEREIVSDIKETHCYVALDPKKEMERDIKEICKTYTLPDGNNIEVGSQLFRAPEVLFAPALIGVEAPGIHKLITNSILKCPIDIRSSLYNSVLLCGGSSMFPGLEQRLFHEMELLAPSTMEINIVAPPERKLCVWIGGSILSNLSAFNSSWVTLKDYTEFGPGIIHKKCL
ncbi:uncharacterized protein LOC128469991 [Spea bombifrons]|uniref:uncharacterized protein LOC128469991 n=1 Tax=Spea bombifrons TaxID=233779 RepID=UPI00234A427F|nr:uncharacterized protein LOC128469991 [Spea bombifrons]